VQTFLVQSFSNLVLEAIGSNPQQSNISGGRPTIHRKKRISQKAKQVLPYYFLSDPTTRNPQSISQDNEATTGTT